MESMKPFPYQEQGVDFLKSHPKAFLFDEPGLGKTAQALWALRSDLPSLVICPKGAKVVWRDECLKLRQDIKPIVVKTRKDFRWPNPGEIVICNPGILPENGELPGQPSQMQICVDEAHLFKNPKAIRTKSLTKLIHSNSSGNGSAWFFTGTPILSSPLDMWGLISSLGIIQETYGSWDNYKRVFNGFDISINRFVKITKFKKPKPGAIDPIRPYVLRRTKAEVLPQLPTKRYEIYKVEAKVKSTFKLTEEEIQAGISGQPSVMQWRKDVSYAKVHLAGEFIKELAESEPVVVFACFKEPIFALAKYLNDSSIATETITGDSTGDQRTKNCERFQKGEISAILGTVQAMGVALTLTKSARVIFIDRDWTPALNLQAEDRVCRIGQDRGVIVTDVVCDEPVDKMVNRVLLKKQELIQNTTELL